MKHFATLIEKLDQTSNNKWQEKHLLKYFQQSNSTEIIHALAVLTDKKPKRILSNTQLKKIAANFSTLPTWLFDESLKMVTDVSETVSLLVSQENKNQNTELRFWMEQLQSLHSKTFEDKTKWLVKILKTLNKQEKFILLKLATATFKIDLSFNTICKALSVFTHTEEYLLMHRLKRDWSVENTTLENLVSATEEQMKNARPYPFFKAKPINKKINISEFIAEWKYQGVSLQLVCRNQEVYIWNNKKEWLNNDYPELVLEMKKLPDGTVLLGEIMVNKKETDNTFVVYDCLELEHKDLRMLSFEKRRDCLESMNIEEKTSFKLSEKIDFENLEDIENRVSLARKKQAKGIMLKHKDSFYTDSLEWYTWKQEPLKVDAVLLYAQKADNSREDLFTHYTFALWTENKLMSFAKTHEGLTDEEVKELDFFIRNNTLEKFGPVRTVKPEMVFEIAFESITESKRHKCGYVVKSPKILQWKKEKKPAEANSLDILKELLIN